MVSIACNLLVISTATAATPDNLDRQLRNGAEKAVNCGIVEPDAKSRTTVNRCVADAVRARRPFIARYNGGSGFESRSQFATGLRLLEDGVFVIYSFDSEGCMVANPPPFCGLILQRYQNVRAEMKGSELRLRCSGTFTF
jgi:hypothetical protein